MKAKTIDRGKVSEYAFAAELLERNIVPLWPSTEMYPYDLVADTGTKRVRIQVKGTNKVGQSISMDIRRSQSGSRSRKYTKKDTDFIVIHIAEYHLWYVIPVGDVKDSITIRPHDHKCKNRKYLEAWHYLE